LLLWWWYDDDMSRVVVGSGRGGGCRSGGGCGEDAGEAVPEDAAAVATTGTVPVVDLASAPSSCGTTAAVVAIWKSPLSSSGVGILCVSTLFLGLVFGKVKEMSHVSQTCQTACFPFSVLRAMLHHKQNGIV
jgi:hypothetical protein